MESILIFIYVLAIVPMRLWLPRQSRGWDTHPWITTFLWPILFCVWVAPHVIALFQQPGRSASIHDPAPAALGYADNTSVRVKDSSNDRDLTF
jgi:hypothetical protein